MDLNKPLAFRMSPKTLEDYVGQEHILGKDKILYRTIKADRLSSIILWGPPGCGKTSLARVISNTTKYKFIKLNAVTSGVGDIKSAIEEAKNPLLNPTGKCILFIDEIHRFNKLQQDALLPFVEDGTVILIGATTENPYFEVNKALISRSMVFKLKPLSAKDVFTILKNAIKKALEKLNVGDIEIEINKPTLQENGDYSSNIAMKLVRVLKKNPLEIANEIVNNISDDNINHIIKELNLIISLC